MTVATIFLTKDNLNNNHFYLPSCLNMFLPASIGGKSETEQATRNLKVRLAIGDEMVPAFDGIKKIFRNCGWVGTTFKVSGEKAGDAVQIEKISNSALDLRVVRGGAI